MRINHLGALAAMALGASVISRGPADEDREEIRVLSLPPDPFASEFIRAPRVRAASNSPSRVYGSRSRYMPHIGTKERARHAHKPDGPMHGLPPLFR